MSEIKIYGCEGRNNRATLHCGMCKLHVASLSFTRTQARMSPLVTVAINREILKILTLVTTNSFKRTWNYIYISNHFLVLWWRLYAKLLYWDGHQDIGNYGIDQYIPTDA